MNTADMVSSRTSPDETFTSRAVHDTKMSMETTDQIYHYTFLSNFVKIIDSRSIFASNLQYTNDALETVFGRDRARDFMREEAARVQANRPAKPPGTAGDGYQNTLESDDPAYWADLLRNIAESLATPSQEDFGVYGVCFSVLGDQLSQWRGYGAGGCAIGFEPTVLLKAARRISDVDVELIDMAYGEAGLQDVLKVLGSIGWQNMTSAQSQNQYNDYGQNLSLAQKAIARLKHEGFSEEKERRLLVSFSYRSRSDPWSLPQYRVDRRGLLLPYIPIPLDLAAIRTITIGPGPYQTLNYEAMVKYCRNIGYQREINWWPEVLRSETPYR